MLEPPVPDAVVRVGAIGPVIGVHTGPRVMGIAWIDRQE
jgi:fatty acid-binding protein DegV